MSKIEILLAMWLVGLLHHTKYAFRDAVRDEGFFWIFQTQDQSQAVRASKFLLAMAATSSFLVFFAIDLKIVLTIYAVLLFASSTVLSYRNS